MSKVVGVRIASESPKDKIYYYNTDEDLKKGDKIDIRVPSGGTPNAIVTIQDSKKKFTGSLKKLDRI